MVPSMYWVFDATMLFCYFVRPVRPKIMFFLHTVFPEIVSGEIKFFDIFRRGNYLKVSKFYVLILTIFLKKGGILFKGGYQ